MTESKIPWDRAVVVGVGVGGIFAAGALRSYFREIILIEKDELPSSPSYRKGVPQGPHGHIVLKRGENIAETFFPGFRAALRAAGGVELSMGRDMARYAFGKWSAPFSGGMTVSSQTRPLLEHVLRESLLSNQNVRIRTQCRFLDFVFDQGRIRGIRVGGRDGAVETIEADLVVEASGRGTATPGWLEENGFGAVETERLGIGLCYVTGVFATDDFDDGRPRLCTVAETPPETRGGTTLPVEGQRWMITLSGRGDVVPTTEIEAFREFARSLPDLCIHDRIVAGRLEGNLRRFRTPESFWRRYERMPEFPDGLIPVGDSVAGFNPIFGQGMSVAAVEAEQLKCMLEARAASGAGLTGLHRDVLPKISEAIGEAWDGPATLDYLYESTQGVRPDDYPTRRAIFFAMLEMAEEDEDLRQAQFDVGNMLKPRASLFTADVVARLQERLGNSIDS